MIRINDNTGRVVLLNPKAIESIKAANANTAQIGCYIRTMTGDEIACRQYPDTIEALIAMHDHEEKRK